MKEFLKYILVFEKARYYSGGALRYPVRITQKFWDELTQRRKCIKEDPLHRGGDTNYGSDDLGERPKVPDWIVELRGSALFMLNVIFWPVFIALLITGRL